MEQFFYGIVGLVGIYGMVCVYNLATNPEEQRRIACRLLARANKVEHWRAAKQALQRRLAGEYSDDLARLQAKYCEREVIQFPLPSELKSGA